MCHVDDSRRLYRVDMMLHKSHHRTYRINHISSLLQLLNQIGRFSHLSCNNNTRRILLPQSICFQKFMIRSYRIESQRLIVRIFRIGMINHIIRPFYQSLRFGNRNPFTVYNFTYIVQHTAIITASAICQVLTQRSRSNRIQRTDIIGRICYGSRKHRHPSVCRLLNLCPLFLGNTKPHGIDKNHIITANAVQFVYA